MTRRAKRLAFAGIAVGAIGLSACGGGAAKPAAVSRTVNVEMRDIAFSETNLSVRHGQTVRFMFQNAGKVAHDAFIGDEKAQTDHASEMRSGASSGMSGMNHGGAAKNSGITVKPGDSGEVVFVFGDPGTIFVGCHQPGHYEAGMRIHINVT